MSWAFFSFFCASGGRVEVVSQTVKVSEEDTCLEKAGPDTLVLACSKSLSYVDIKGGPTSWMILQKGIMQERWIGSVWDGSDGQRTMQWTVDWPVEGGDLEGGAPSIWALPRLFVPLLPFLPSQGSESPGQGPETCNSCSLFPSYPIFQLHS